MVRPIVAGVVESHGAWGAPEWAAREALRRELPLRLVHAWEPGLPGDPSPAGPGSGPAPASGSASGRVPGSGPGRELGPGWGTGPGSGPPPGAAQAHARHVLHGLLDRLGERYPRLHITAEQVPRPPVPTLIAEAENAELLVIGGQDSTGLGGFLSGSVAMATAARIDRPLVMVRGGHCAEDEHLPDAAGGPSPHTPFRDVAVAVDIDGSSQEVLQAAFDAAELRRAPLRVVHAWHAPFPHGFKDRTEHARAREQAERELADLLEPWRDKHPAVQVKGELHEGRPAHVLVHATAGACLVVVGHRTRRAGTGPHTGAVAHALIHHVHGPVVLVPHP